MRLSGPAFNIAKHDKTWAAFAVLVVSVDLGPQRTACKHWMVRDRGFEPLTPSVSRKCSTTELTAQPNRKPVPNRLISRVLRHYYEATGSPFLKRVASSKCREGSGQKPERKCSRPLEGGQARGRRLRANLILGHLRPATPLPGSGSVILRVGASAPGRHNPIIVGWATVAGTREKKVSARSRMSSRDWARAKSTLN
jgi:hypothetical protein